MSKQQKRQRQKHNNNSKDAENVIVRPVLSSCKRLDLNILIRNLYNLANKMFTNPKEEWQQYVEIQKMLNETMALENALSPRLALLEKANAAGVSVDELRVQNIAAFNEWLTMNGVNFDGLCIAEFSGYGLGIQATRDIKTDEVLFSIPRKMMLNEDWLEREHDEAGSLSGITLTNVKLAYTLLLEKLKGADSFWQPYIDILPMDYNTALYWDAEDMQELRGSNALSVAARHCRVIARQYAAMYNCLQNAPRLDMISKMGQTVKEFFCYDLYRWAVSTATTRQNLIPKQSAKDRPDPHNFIATLIPFWDMVNHKHGNITTFYQPEADVITSAAQSDFKKGEQIFMHYGNRPNAELMIHNGFVNSNNPNDYVNIKMGLSNSDPLFTQRSNVLHWLEIPINGCELAVYPAPEYISGQLLAFVRVFNMNEQQLEHWNSPDYAKDLLHVDCALETELESKTWKYLQTRLMLLLRAFPTTIDEDLDMLLQDSQGVIELGYKRAMILEYRVLEKRILADALEYVTQRSKA